MPKDLQACSNLVSRKARRSCHHPYNNSGKGISDGNVTIEVGSDAQKKEWDNAMCLICLEHPHNAVLLLCSSYDKGCRPFMCDTSSRHSNCFDQYRKQSENCRNVPSQGVEIYTDHPGDQALISRSQMSLDDVDSLGEPWQVRRALSGSQIGRVGQSEISQHWRALHGLTELQSDMRRDVVIRDRNHAAVEGETSVDNLIPHRIGTEVFVNDSMDLKCPLCRGAVTGWKVVEAARKYLNAKVRSCSHELCSFSGTYEELRRHARRVHPTARPAEVDPARQRAWQDSELSRDFEDMLSTIRSAMPGAIVLGDYVIDNENEIHLDQAEGDNTLFPSGSWWTRFFLFHMFSPIASFTDARGLPVRWRSSRRQHMPAGLVSGQSVLWQGNVVEDGNEEPDNASANEAVNGAGSGRRRHSNQF